MIEFVIRLFFAKSSPNFFSIKPKRSLNEFSSQLKQYYLITLRIYFEHPN